MRLFDYVVGVNLIVVAGMSAIQQLVMLARCHRGVGTWRLVSLPTASLFRVCLLLIAQGVLLLQAVSAAGSWVVTGLWTALISWHLGIWLRARLLRRRPRTAA
ncbi:MAG TPA: hypothetical protein VMA72_27650 [Streptosporangiaceae bacterium]|nr:hypothetical protein [Streptosporangiaceae bacterium]